MNKKRRKKQANSLSAVFLPTFVLLTLLLPAIRFLFTDTCPVSGSAPLSGNVPTEEYSLSGYYYQSLSESERKLYNELLQGVQRQAEVIYLPFADADEISRIYQFIICDRPELFWCSGEIRMRIYKNFAKVCPAYSCTGKELAQKQADIDAAARTALSGITPDASEYDTIRYIFEYLVNTVDYDVNAPDNQNIYSALVNRRSVCAGYSRAAQYLLLHLGIECIYVTGTVPGRGAHAWNIVKCNNRYYQLDVTFADPVFVQKERSSDIQNKTINYSYLCCTDAELYQNHIPDEPVLLPECTSFDLNYYVLNHMYYDSYEPNVILENMKQSIRRKEASFTCKFSGEEPYLQARGDLIENLLPQAAQTLLTYYGLSGTEYSYIDDSQMHMITVYWNY